jgi:gliding motility-associated-like protein
MFKFCSFKFDTVIKALVFLFFVSFLQKSSAQVLIDTLSTPTQLVQNVLLGEGIIASNITFIGPQSAIVGFQETSEEIGFSSGLILTNGSYKNVQGPNVLDNSSFSNNGDGDSDLNTLTTGKTKDATILEFDFEGIADTVVFRYVFASEEYNEFVCSEFNDVFGFFVSGPGIVGVENVALIPGTTTEVAINTINNGAPGTFGDAANCSTGLNNKQFYRDNKNGQLYEYDGFTVVLEAKFAVQACEIYHIKLAIADVSDFIYDSGVFFEVNSFSNSSADLVFLSASTNGNGTEMAEGCNVGEICFTRRAGLNQPKTVYFEFSGEAKVVTDYTSSLKDSVVFGVGVSEICIDITALSDLITESSETLILTLVDTSLCSNPSVQLLIYDIDSMLTLEVFTDTTICEGETVILTAKGEGGSKQFNISWSDGAIGPFNPVQPDTTTVYIVTLVDFCTGDTLLDTVTVEVTPILISPTISPMDTLICKGDSIQVVITGGMEFEWIPATGVSNPAGNNVKVSPPKSTSYEIVVTDTALNECPVSVFINVAVFDFEVPPTATVCIEGSVEIIALGGPSTNYLWTPANIVSNVNDSTIMAFPTTPTTVSVAATSKEGCMVTKTIQVGVDEIPETTISDDIVICKREGVPIEVNGGTGYSWSPSSSLSKPFSGQTEAFPIESTKYVVTIFNGACQVKDSVNVFVREEIEPDFTFETMDCSKKAIFSNLTPTDDEGFNFLMWKFDNGDTSTKENPTYTYQDSGTYKVVLINNPNTSCSDSVVKEVLIEPTEVDTFDLPNVFTPNDDNVNDVFKIEIEDGACEIISLRIYSRWGDEVFRIEDRFNLFWDGNTPNGGKAAKGVYFYVFETDEGDQIKGTINLYR